MHENVATTQPFALAFTVTLSAVIHPEPDVGGYSAEVPALPGCYTEGETLDEIRANLKEAAEAWLASAHDHAAQPRAEGAA
jgi:predicted RNase H-like HicB family nuclease